MYRTKKENTDYRKKPDYATHWIALKNKSSKTQSNRQKLIMLSADLLQLNHFRKHFFNHDCCSLNVGKLMSALGQMQIRALRLRYDNSAANERRI